MTNANVTGYDYGEGAYGSNGYGLTSLSVSTDQSVTTATQIPDTTTTEASTQSIQPSVNTSPFSILSDSTSTGSTDQFVITAIDLASTTITTASAQFTQSSVDSSQSTAVVNSVSVAPVLRSVTDSKQIIIDRLSIIGYDYGNGEYGERTYGASLQSVSVIPSVTTATDVSSKITTNADVDTDTITVVGTLFNSEITILLAQDPSRDINSTPTVEYADTDTDTVIYTTEHTNTYE